jgi:hypothetical protein
VKQFTACILGGMKKYIPTIAAIRGKKPTKKMYSEAKED